MHLIANYSIYFIELIETPWFGMESFQSIIVRQGAWKVGEKEKDPRLGSKGSEYFRNTAWMFGSLDPKQYQIIFYVSNFCDYIWPL